MARSIHFVLAAGLAGLVPACSPAPPAEAPSEAAVGLDLAGRDLAVAPGDDFSAYANGGWSATTEIPADRSSTGTGLMIYERTEERLAELIAGAVEAPKGTLERKIGDYFAASLDEASIDAKGTEPLAEIQAEIAAIEDRGDLAGYLGRTLRADVDAFNNTDHYTDQLFGLWVAQDLDGAGVYVPFLMQGGLDMPNRAFYLDDSAPMEAHRAACRTHIANLLRLLGVDDVETRSDRVFELERRMAQAHWTREDSGEIAKGNNPWPRQAFSARAPGLDWDAYFTAAGLAEQPTFIVWQPSAVAGLAALAGSEPLDTWKNYLLFHAADHYAAVLPRAFRKERFDFHERILSGTPEMLPRRRQAIAETSEALGEEVGKLYVERYFPPADKARIEAMVENIKQAFRGRIEALDWMAPETKARALGKLVDLQVSDSHAPPMYRVATVRNLDPWYDAFGVSEGREMYLAPEERVRIW